MYILCRYLRDEYLVKNIYLDEYWASLGYTVFIMETPYRKLTLMEKVLPKYEKTRNCKCCGGKISGDYGYISVDDTFLWIYTQRSGYCKECAEKKAKHLTEINSKNNKILYEQSKVYITAHGSRRYYKDGGIVEDVGQDIIQNPLYTISIS